MFQNGCDAVEHVTSLTTESVLAGPASQPPEA